MKERPILFSAQMVRAILSGSKSQTRRAVKPQPDEHHWQWLPGYEVKHSEMVTIDGRCAVKFAHSIPQNRAWDDASRWVCCPYGAPGDRLWVKETFYAWGRWETRYSAKKGRDEWHFVDMTLESGRKYLSSADNDHYAANLGANQGRGAYPGWWKRPAIFMTRAASRITLEITSVRVERLQDISEADALAEGIAQVVRDKLPVQQCGEYDGIDVDPVDLYRDIWESINGPDSWAANPWVWVIEFRRLP